MAYEEIWAPLLTMLMLALALFPAIYILDIIRQRVDAETTGKKIKLLFISSFLLAIVFYPFAIAEDFLPFNSAPITYALALLVVFLYYLITFNKTKE